MKNKLFVLGSLNIDLSINASRFPKRGETVNGSQFTQNLGGKGLNQAYYASELGVPTILMSSIGNDNFKEFIFNGLNATSIIPKIQIKNKVDTGKAIIIKSENDNSIVLDHGANYLHNFDKIKAMIANTQPKYFLTQLEIPFQIAFDSLKFAKSQKIITFLNATPAEINYDDVYKYVDYLIINETEADLLSQEILSTTNSLSETADYFLNKNTQHVIITLGEKGSYYKSKDFEYFQKAISTQVVNTIGAGDSFIGALIYGLSQNKNIKESLLIATKVSSQVCASDSLHLTDLEV